MIKDYADTNIMKCRMLTEPFFFDGEHSQLTKKQSTHHLFLAVGSDVFARKVLNKKFFV